MLRNTFQSGFVSIFFSLGSKPLQMWKTLQGNTDGSFVRPVVDEDINSQVLELRDDNVANTRIECPADPSDTLAITLPYVVLVVKNMQRYFTFELELLDDLRVTRRFRCSNYQVEPRITDDLCTMPLVLEPGWNTVTLDLRKLVNKAYGTIFAEVSGVVVHANARVRRIYFAEKLVAEENLPAEFKMYGK